MAILTLFPHKTKRLVCGLELKSMSNQGKMIPRQTNKKTDDDQWQVRNDSDSSIKRGTILRSIMSENSQTKVVSNDGETSGSWCVSRMIL